MLYPVRSHKTGLFSLFIFRLALQTSRITTSYALVMNNLPLEPLTAQATAYAAAHGLQVERKEGNAFECAPISLLPQAFPRAALAQAQTLAPHFNTLVDRISRNGGFLQQTLGGSVSQADAFTRKLLELYRDIYVSSPEATPNFAAQADRLGIQRSDYMLHRDQKGDAYAIKQVELNTIASSFGGLGRQVTQLHQYLTARFASDKGLQDFLAENEKAVLGRDQKSSDDTGVPDNPTLERLPAALAVAVKRYQRRFAPVKPPVVLFVVQPSESNTVDQRLLEFALWQQHQIPVVRLSLAKAHDKVTLDPTSGALSYDNQEIAVVYYRAGYAPTDYPSGPDGVEWQGRAKLERSRATKCPSLGYHLAGTKKVQQELARPGVLERFFCQDAAAVEAMRAAFAGLYSLGEDATEEDLKAVRHVLEDGGEGAYVLKPQREGGGYNFYGDDLKQKLQDNVQASENTLVLDKKLGEFILMERLFPPRQEAILLRAGRVQGSGDSVSELGCFGTIVASPEGEVVHNEYAGFLLRTKLANVDEGGVASGFATLSSPYLC